jgi:hypothetical protein
VGDSKPATLKQGSSYHFFILGPRLKGHLFAALENTLLGFKLLVSSETEAGSAGEQPTEG